MCDLCELNKSTDGLVVTICRTCRIPLIVSRKHGSQLTSAEYQLIRQIFPRANIRWEMRQIKDHAHAHIDS